MSIDDLEARLKAALARASVPEPRPRGRRAPPRPRLRAEPPRSIAADRPGPPTPPAFALPELVGVAATERADDAPPTGAGFESFHEASFDRPPDGAADSADDIEIPAVEVTSEEARREAFRRAAAVLWQYVPDALVPDDERPAAPGEAATVLADDALRVRTRDGGGGAWTLRDRLRPGRLAELGPEELRALRARYQGPVAPAQALIDRWWTGADPRLGEYDVDDLAILARLRTWFDPPPPHLPSPEQLEQLRASARFRAPLRALAGSDIGGRAGELARLDELIGAPDGETPSLLVLHGGGGCGKSTLAAQYLLERLYRDRAQVFGYLDVDEPGIDVADGVGLVLELAAQIAAQRSELPAVAAVAARAASTATSLGGSPGAPGRARALTASAAELAAELGQALRDAAIARVVLVLDSFELGLHASQDRERFLGEQLALLHARLPGLRTLVVSRAPLALPAAHHLEVGDFDDAAARGYLHGKGVTGEEEVAAALGTGARSPASLSLAIELLRDGGAGALAGIEPGGGDALVVELYRRFAATLPGEAGALLVPAVVLRRWTAELLATVVAPAAGLPAPGEDAASELIARLAAHGAVFSRGDGGVLELRAQVRSAVLAGLVRDEPAMVRELHAAAAAHHDAREAYDEATIADAAYHHLALGDTDGPWLARLSTAAAMRLRDALPELPPASWPVIAARAQIDLPAAAWADADPALLERRLADRMRELLRVDRAEDVALLVADAPPAPNSRLWRWYGRACALLGRDADALDALGHATTDGEPAEELRADARLAERLATRVRAAEGARRTPHWRSGAAILLPRPFLRARRRADRPWLDDGDLRRLIHRAIDGDRPACDECDDGPPPARAARMFADASRLVVAPADDEGSVPLLAWIERVIGPPEVVIAELGLRFDPPT